MDVRNLLSLSGVLLVLGAAGYYWGLGQSGPATLGAAGPQLPDYEVKDIESLQTDEQGQLLRRLRAESVVHYPKPDDRAIMQHPEVLLYQDGKPVWKVNAAQGTSLGNGKNITLENGVVGERVETGQVPVTVRTATLTVFPESETLRTTAAVTITSPQASLQSQGLDADLKNSTINLHSQVRGTYVTHP